MILKYTEKCFTLILCYSVTKVHQSTQLRVLLCNRVQQTVTECNRLSVTDLAFRVY